MTASYRNTHNLLAISANAMESALNTFQTLDTTLLVDSGAIVNLTPRREDNSDEITGYEEITRLDDMGNTSDVTISFPRAQPQHFALMLAYALGEVTATAAGSGYLHTITPIDTDLDGDRSNPTFSLLQRLGKTILNRRFASLAVDSVTANFSQDSFVTLSATCKGTGKYEDDITTETVTGTASDTTLTLANQVEGDTAAERLANVQAIRAETASGVWEDVAFSAVSDADPAVVTITAPGTGTTDISYEVIYRPADCTWSTYPDRVTETAMRVAQAYITVGGTWDGTSFSGGRNISVDIKTLEWTLSNNMAVEFAPGAGDSYASRIWREGRSQTLKVDRFLKDMILQEKLKANAITGLRVICEGAEFDDGYKFGVEIIFPRLGFKAAPVGNEGTRNTESVELAVMEGTGYPSVIVKVQNEVSAYAA